MYTTHKPSRSHFWIRHSGASEHMTFDSTIIFNVKTLTRHVNVNLSNSQSNLNNQNKEGLEP